MLSKKSLRLKEIIESKGGLHLTAYLRACDDPQSLKIKLRDMILTALEHLAPSTSREERNRFLRPLMALMTDHQFLQRLPRGNIAIFRSKRLFRILSLPREVEDQCIVAASFHVKPLLEWIQIDREFLILGLAEGEAVLFGGSLQSFRKLDEIRGESRYGAVQDSWRLTKARDWWADETAGWLNSWIKENIKGPAPKLYLAGEWKFVRRLVRRLRQLNPSVDLAGPAFQSDQAAELCQDVRQLQELAARAALTKTFMEFYLAENQNRTRKNLFEIAAAAAQGQVRKLIVASGIQIFGRVDEATGALKVNRTAHDHEDDDVLDDLAQLVIARGGEVLVAPLEQIPRKRPALAILKTPAPPTAVRVDSPQMKKGGPDAVVSANAQAVSL